MNNIYIVYGENFWSYKRILKKKVAQNYLKTLDEFNYIKLNMNDTTIENLVYECRSSGLFGNEKVVVAENCNFLLAKPKKLKVDHNIEVLSNYLEI